MGSLIDQINNPNALKKLNTQQLNLLAEEIREYIIENTSVTGGHLAPNLGTVELTIALHRVLRVPADTLVWDVGHQSYTHKILTGRKDAMKTLRQIDGECGFCDPNASEYDSYTSGHTSTSLSLAFGAACARDKMGKKYNVAAVIGDGALAGGMAMEALDCIGDTKKNMLIVLNDNEMSISKNIGAMSNYLARARTSNRYLKSKQEIDSVLTKLPKYGESITRAVRKIKDNFKSFVSPGVFFEELGITYLGPFDGHDIRQMEEVFRSALKLNEPVLVHVITKKGKGFEPAEKEPHKYHGVSPFDPVTGAVAGGGMNYSSVFGDEMCNIAEKNERVAMITPAMTLGSGLAGFEKKFPDRFYDVGIAEAHAVTFAAGLAGAGMVPVVALYSTFAQRAYDSFIHDVAISNLHVVFAIDRAGLVPGDGKTHQGIFDISYFSEIPNFTILSPCSFDELRKMLNYAVNECNGPVVVRYPRGGEEHVYDAGDFVPSKADVVCEGNHISVACEGVALCEVMKAKEILSRKGINAEIINVRTIHPVDMDTIKKSVLKTGALVCVEQGIEKGGMGEGIIAALAKEGVQAKLASIALDGFVTHGTYDEIKKRYSLDAESIAERVEKEWLDGKEKA